MKDKYFCNAIKEIKNYVAVDDSNISKKVFLLDTLKSNISSNDTGITRMIEEFSNNKSFSSIPDSKKGYIISISNGIYLFPESIKSYISEMKEQLYSQGPVILSR